MCYLEIKHVLERKSVGERRREREGERERGVKQNGREEKGKTS